MRSRRNRIEYNLPQPMLSPMIDMIFLLLVFFIVSTMYMIEVKTIPVKLPQAAYTETISKSNFIVTIKKDGTLFLEDEKIEKEDLYVRAKNKLLEDENFAVILRGDKEVEYGLVIKLMDGFKANGIIRFGLATELRKEK